MRLDSQEELRRLTAKEGSFLGSVKVNLRHLEFNYEASNSSAAFLDPKNVARLSEIFKIEGCLRLEPEHHIPALISEAQLEESLRITNATRSDLLGDRSCLNELEFDSEVKLRCLHGKHRIAAAKLFLGVGQKWWAVDLYRESLETLVQQEIQDQYTNAKNFCDGDIYRYLRQCQLKNDKAGERRWLARISPCKRKDVYKFLRREELQGVVEAFDTMLPISGLWPALQLGTFHRLLSLKCPEELRYYLQEIWTCWDFITNNGELAPFVDYQTVRALEMRNPELSRADRNYIEECVNTEQIFPGLRDRTTRINLIQRLRQVKYNIPSLYTFFEDTKWLEPCAKILRLIFDVGIKESVKGAASHCFNGGKRLLLLRNDYQYRCVNTSEQQAAESGYQQLWLFAWRHFPQLSGVLPRRDVGTHKPQHSLPSDIHLHSLASLAIELGFYSDKLVKLRENDPDVKLIKHFMTQARPQEFYDTEDMDQASRVEMISNVLKTIKVRKQDLGNNMDYGTDVDLKYRCGRPFEGAHKVVQPLFFIEDVFCQSSQAVTHLVVQSQIFRRFFGREFHISHAQIPVVGLTRSSLGLAKRPLDNDAEHQGVYQRREKDAEGDNGGEHFSERLSDVDNPADVMQLDETPPVTTAVNTAEDWYHQYQKHCKPGWFFIIMMGTFEIYILDTKGEPFESFRNNYMSDHYFATWIPSAKQVQCVEPSSWRLFARKEPYNDPSAARDGIIYGFQKGTIDYQTIGAGTPGERLIAAKQYMFRGGQTRDILWQVNEVEL